MDEKKPYSVRGSERASFTKARQSASVLPSAATSASDMCNSFAASLPLLNAHGRAHTRHGTELDWPDRMLARFLDVGMNKDSVEDELSRVRPRPYVVSTEYTA